MLTQVQLKRVVNDFVNNCPREFGKGLMEEADALARNLKRGGVLRHLKSLKEEAAHQARLREKRAQQKDRSGDSLHNRLPGQACLRRERILIRICDQQVTERELSSPAGWFDAEKEVTDHDPQSRMWVVNAVYFFEYSRREGSWLTGASYLVGREDGQYWASRVPRYITKIREALDWLEPAAVKQARTEGRWIARQGDVFLVELKRGQDNLVELPGSHRFDPERRELRHGQHAPVQVPPHPVKAFRAASLQPGASAGAD